MSEREACGSFSQHAWKKDLCVNCGRLRSAHADFPKPAKRLSKGNINYKVPVNQSKSDDPTKRQDTPPRVLHKNDAQQAESYADGSNPAEPGKDGSHYYHKYDVTKKGAPGPPVTPEIIKRNKAKESAKTAAFVHTFIPVEDFSFGREQKYNEAIEESKKKLAKHQRVVEVAAAEQNVALPYTIVDVSTIPHDVNPDSLESKPQAPNNPPAHPATMPRRAKPKTVLSGHGTNPSPAKRQELSAQKTDNLKNKNDGMDKSNSHSTSEKNEDKKAAAPMPTILYDDDHNRKDNIMSPNSQRKVAILIPSAPFPVSHVYEDIDEGSGESPKISRKNGKSDSDDKRKVSQPIKIMESNKFDENMQAIAKTLDLAKEKKTDSVMSNSIIEKEENSNKETVDTKQEKGKKPAGGGKGFLSRFFSKGNKSEEPQQEDGMELSTDRDSSVVASELEWTRSQSVDCGSTSGGKAESPVNRVRKSVARSESTKEQSALQSELKNILVKGAPKTERSSSVDASSRNKVHGTERGKDITVLPVKGDLKGPGKPDKTKKPDVAGRPSKPKKPERGKIPETPISDKKLNVVIDKAPIGEKPQISPPKPMSPVKPKPTRRAKSVVEPKVQTESAALTCDTSDKSPIPESPVSPGKLEISMPKLEQSTINVEMISSLYSNVSDQSLSPREPCSSWEPQSPRSEYDESMTNDKSPGASVKSRPKSEFIKARAVKRMSAAPPPPPPGGAPVSPPITTRSSAVSPLPDVLDSGGLPNDIMTKSFDRTFTHSTLPKHFERPKIPEKLPPEKAARNRRQAKADKNGTGRSATLTEGIHLEPNAIMDINFKEKEKETEGDDYRGSKFIDRALPSPPSARRPQRDNIYEDIDVDDDGYYDDIVELAKSISIDSGASDVAEGIRQPDVIDDDESLLASVTNALQVSGNVMTTSAEYLEPISRSESTSGDSITNIDRQKEMTFTVSNNNSSSKTSPTTPPTPTNYIDTIRWDPNGKFAPDNYGTGFLQMDIIHTRTLQSIVTDVCWEPQVMHDRRQGRLKMTDFKMETKKPILQHSSCMFYKVSTTKLEEMHNCILMISQKKAPTALTNCNNMNILKPVAVFSENAQLDSKPGTYAQAATVGVFNFADISSLQDYLKQKFSNQPSVLHVKQNTVLYVLIQVLNGLLWMVEQNITPRSLTTTDILVATSTSTTDQRLLLNPFRIKDTDKKMSRLQGVNRLYADFAKLALSVIGADKADKTELCKVLRSAGYADHSMALSYALNLENGLKVDNANIDVLTTAQQILEISLWGPSVDQLNAMLSANDPLVACHVWLALQRCTILSSHAVQGCSAAASWENTAYLNFLSTCTPERLLEVAQKIIP